jgi:hypothetical protein
MPERRGATQSKMMGSLKRSRMKRRQQPGRNRRTTFPPYPLATPPEVFQEPGTPPEDDAESVDMADGRVGAERSLTRAAGGDVDTEIAVAAEHPDPLADTVPELDEAADEGVTLIPAAVPDLAGGATGSAPQALGRFPGR